MNLPPSLFTRQIASNTDKDSREFSALDLSYNSQFSQATIPSM